MLAKIISGGQTGVDRAALDVALELGIECDGFCPRGRKAEDGVIPGRYPMREMQTDSYPARTRANVRAAHATLILADVADHSELEGGTRLTFDIAFQAGSHGAGLFLVDLRNPKHVGEVAEWLRECIGDRKGFILNIAGPRESKNPGIHGRAAAFLRKVLGSGFVTA